MLPEATIYGVYDASDPLKVVRYVGATCNPLEQRLLEHRQGRGCNNCMNEWLKLLKLRGSRPAIRALERVPAFESGAAEQKWIAHWRAKNTDAIGILNLFAGGFSGAHIRSHEHWRDIRRLYKPRYPGASLST